MKSNPVFPIRTIAALTLVSMLSACSSFRIPFFSESTEKDTSYATARSAIKNKSLEVPPDLTAPGGGAGFSIPGLANLQLSSSGQKILETGAVLPSFEKARMEYAGSQRWLVIKAPVETVWPEARKFWLDQGFKLTSENPALGMLETDFLEQKPELPIGPIRGLIARGLGTLYSTGIVDQYRMRLERSTEPGSTEIYISHQGMEEVFTNRDQTDTRWTTRKPDPELEAAMLKKLLVRFGITDDTATKMVSGSAITASPNNTKAQTVSPAKAQILTTDGVPVLQMNEGFERAWRRVGLALERNGYTITDRDRQKGIYFIKPGTILQANEEQGFFSKLAFWRSNDKKLPESSINTPEHEVNVVSAGENTLIKISTKNSGQQTDSNIRRILEPLLEELR